MRINGYISPLLRSGFFFKLVFRVKHTFFVFVVHWDLDRACRAIGSSVTLGITYLSQGDPLSGLHWCNW